ncbi:hypothetical protein Taro_044466, partial [Colocasia esculenta]|nr:hypothetical protein [Colocasia esculenta]
GRKPPRGRDADIAALLQPWSVLLGSSSFPTSFLFDLFTCICRLSPYSSLGIPISFLDLLRLGVCHPPIQCLVVGIPVCGVAELTRATFSGFVAAIPNAALFLAGNHMALAICKTMLSLDWPSKTFFYSSVDGQDHGDQKQSTADMTVFVQNLLAQMQNRFQTMSNSIVQKNILFYVYTSVIHQAFIRPQFLISDVGHSLIILDEMGSRIDELEQSINNLKTEMGIENEPTAKPEEKAPASEPMQKDE